ncbi:hypothetical protein SLEP1_g28825 [Rubroshorea leprosula]|uniref:DUF4219 domain-containing protein n=1 Tax=Rubroshorea leprosula TaxID=152421 RepID=A0AAV5K0L2_9ROSI|nr:hypothetical protein SLEP1_g28825 [Rubroshorea leprosula]
MATCPSMIVPEVLRKENYERWSILMEHYLVAQNLWDVVQVNEMPGQGEWIQKNALALHAIKVSCGTEMFNRIKKINSAKAAWDALAEMQGPPSYHDIVELQEAFSMDIDGLQVETLTGFITSPLFRVCYFFCAFVVGGRISIALQVTNMIGRATKDLA